jgi:hypothetical protein
MSKIFTEMFLNKHVKVAKKDAGRIFTIDGILIESDDKGILLSGETKRFITWDAVNDITLIE